jgi:hypothetical protein
MRIKEWQLQTSQQYCVLCLRTVLRGNCLTPLIVVITVTTYGSLAFLCNLCAEDIEPNVFR